MFRFYRTGPVGSFIAALSILLSTGPALSGATRTAISTSPDPSVIGQAVSITTTVLGSAPSGKVTVKDGSKSLGVRTLTTAFGSKTLGVGEAHACALSTTGAVKCWGRNQNGQLGDGNGGPGVYTPYPVQVSGLTSGVIEVVTGDHHSCALTHQGAVKCWGRNGDGQLGDGSKTDRHTPVQVHGLSSGVMTIAAGSYHTCAITAGGAARCWGSNNTSQIGDLGSITSDRPLPVEPYGLSSGVADIGGGFAHSCALLATGAVKCWGRGGRIGDGGSTIRYGPTQVTGLTAGVAAIAVGGEHSCALTSAGGVKCWGDNPGGQIGDGSTTDRLTPVPVVGMSSGVAALAAGGSYNGGITCVVTDTRAGKCWGVNNYGQLGDGTITNRTTPTAVSGMSSGIYGFAGGPYTTCGVTLAGSLLCWGDNSNGQIGDNTTTQRLTPVAVSGFGAATAAVPAYARFATTALDAGRHRLRATYPGDTDNAASASPQHVHTVDKGDTKIKQVKVSPKTPKAGKTARVTVKLKALAPAKGNPDGKVVVKDGKKKLGPFKVKNGKAGFKWKKPKKGKHNLKLTFNGGGNWNKSSAKKTVTVKK